MRNIDVTLIFKIRKATLSFGGFSSDQFSAILLRKQA